MSTLELNESSCTKASQEEWAFFTSLNALRANGTICPGGEVFPPSSQFLKFDCRTRQVARLHTADMAQRNYFSHLSQDGKSVYQRAAALGVVAEGEVISAGAPGGASTLLGLHQSDGHCQYLMHPSFKVVGIGYAYSGDSEHHHYWNAVLSSKDTSASTCCYP